MTLNKSKACSCGTATDWLADQAHARRVPIVITDAHPAALATKHGAKLYTTDEDFSRFDDLQVVNPLLK